MPQVIVLFRLVLIALAATLGVAAQADVWPDPEKEITFSANKEYRLTVYPAPEKEVEAYFREEGAKRPNATARLQRKSPRGGWKTVWKKPLLNEIAPTDALVADDGRYVVTFDNWYSTGHGENVVVIYGADGSVVRSMKLTDIVPEFYMATLSHSVSSVDWREDEGLNADGETIFIDIYRPGQSHFSSSDNKTLRFTIDLSDGRVGLPEAGAWEKALSEARVLALALVRENLAYEQMMRNPIKAPAGCGPAGWRTYFYEVSQREAPQGEDADYVSPHILLPVSEEDSERRSTNFKWAPSNRHKFEQRIAVVAPCAFDVLLSGAREIAERGETFNRATIWISATRSEYEQVDAVLARTGIKTRWLDPDEPIPQRADRVPDNLEFIAEIEAVERQLMAEIAAEGAD
ncbi:MAG: hypothetical protein AAF687_10005 [Pseudomonadota bacterium]